eukprot:TRINITY_DN2473_c0_g1_i1.p1 TRINITY_DN2473_c0_g1~~TRINITY_DN2473_c0_g1_i1.p1  ORF type:complete len:294 (+),score=67.31 TRINITY_DN2473_c0_g1_i1:48-929(+)
MAWSNQKYDAVHLFLGFVYLFIFLLSLGIVLKLIFQRKLLSAGWPKFFHPLLMAGCFIRSIFFILQPFIMEDNIKVENKTNVILNSLPSFLFFTNYLIILFIWAEIYHYAHRSTQVGISKLRPIFITVNVVMYIVIFFLYLLSYLMYPKPDYLNVSNANDKAEIALFWFDITIYFFTSVGFLAYGTRIYYKFARVPVYTKSRRHILRKIQVITVLVSLCFLIRIGLILLDVAFNVNVSGFWWFDGTYYFCLEVIPLGLMLYLLHGHNKSAAKRHVNSDEGRYHEESPLVVSPE